jgi:hypothetical protein
MGYIICRIFLINFVRIIYKMNGNKINHGQIMDNFSRDTNFLCQEHQKRAEPPNTISDETFLNLKSESWPTINDCRHEIDRQNICHYWVARFVGETELEGHNIYGIFSFLFRRVGELGICKCSCAFSDSKDESEEAYW